MTARHHRAWSILWSCVVLVIASMAVGAAGAAPKFEDSIGQRMQACTGCHGAQGRAGPDGYYPRIAGKPAGYLYNQLLNFRDGRRHYAIMTALLDPLSDAYLKEIAEYFAGLDLPYPPPAPNASAPPDLSARGRRLVMEGDANLQVPACIQCHGAAMTGVAPAIPGLVGLPRDYLAAQLGAFRAGNRNGASPDCMKLVAQRLSVADVGAVTQWLSTQQVPEHAKPAERLGAPLPQPCGGVPELVMAGAHDVPIPSTPPGTPATADQASGSATGPASASASGPRAPTSSSAPGARP